MHAEYFDGLLSGDYKTASVVCIPYHEGPYTEVDHTSRKSIYLLSIAMAFYSIHPQPSCEPPVGGIAPMEEAWSSQ